MDIPNTVVEIDQKTFNILCQGFILGFEISMDGWNGESFKAFDRPLIDSEIFRAKMEEAIMTYLLTGKTKEERNHVIN
jgi:hypothetical protein